MRDFGIFWENTWILSENSLNVDVLLYKSLCKLLDMYILADFSKVSHSRSIFSSMTKSLIDFLDVLKSPGQHLSVGSKIIPIASQKVENYFPNAKLLFFSQI